MSEVGSLFIWGPGSRAPGCPPTACRMAGAAGCVGWMVGRRTLGGCAISVRSVPHWHMIVGWMAHAKGGMSIGTQLACPPIVPFSPTTRRTNHGNHLPTTDLLLRHRGQGHRREVHQLRRLRTALHAPRRSLNTKGPRQTGPRGTVGLVGHLSSGRSAPKWRLAGSSRRNERETR